VEDRHDTEPSDENVALEGTATVTCVQVDPFHAKLALPDPSLPTAMQNDGPAQETLVNSLSELRGTDTPGTTLHVAPFHCSIRSAPPVDSSWSPTPTQNDDVGHATASSPFSAEPAAALVFVQLDAETNGGAGESSSGRAGHHATHRQCDQRAGRGDQERSESSHRHLLPAPRQLRGQCA